MKLSWILLLAVWLGFVPMYLGNKPFCHPNGNCYTVLLTELKFTNANISCGPKGSLATMRNEQEKNETRQFSTYLQNERNISKFWIGLYLPEKTCTVKDKNITGFIWISGEDTTVSEWRDPPKISCTIRRRCALLQWDSGDSERRNPNWSWKSEKCSKKYPSICRLSTDFSTSEDMGILSPTPTAQPMMFMTSAVQTTELIPSTINVICREFRENETNTCKVDNIPYSCNDTHCFCGQMDDKGGGYGLRRCQENLNESCLGQCIMSSNISCVCGNHQMSCDQAECTINATNSAMSTSPMVHAATSSPINDDDENLFDKLIIPLILGLVVLGILVMLIWGGVQMCVRKRKPKRKKSIIPVAEPEASDTDSTDNSSSDEEGESQDMTEMA